KDARMIEIMNYIQANYIDVTLDDLAEKFYLSKPYLSKYIREKSGMTFGDLVKKIRMKKARALLKSSNMTVENIALSVGYQNVEHFNRLFKKAYNMTPMQFRNQKESIRDGGVLFSSVPVCDIVNKLPVFLAEFMQWGYNIIGGNFVTKKKLIYMKMEG